MGARGAADRTDYLPGLRLRIQKPRKPRRSLSGLYRYPFRYRVRDKGPFPVPYREDLFTAAIMKATFERLRGYMATLEPLEGPQTLTPEGTSW